MNFEIESSITLKEFILISLGILYRRTLFILILCAFLLLNGFILLSKLDIVHLHLKDNVPVITNLTIFLVLIHVFYIVSMVRQYRSATLLQQPRKLQFSNDNIAYKTDGASGFIEWRYILKYKFVSGFILLYTSNRAFIFVKKNKLTKEQVEFIVNKVKSSKQ